MFYSKKLQKFSNIKHCFFSKKNGVSKGIYKSLNCGLGSNDNKSDILKNLKIVRKHISCKKESLITLKQRHSSNIVFIEKIKSNRQPLNGDALITMKKNVAIGILTADCIPILFYDPINKIVGCAHAGWKGTYSGIIENTIKRFKSLNCELNELVAVIGPCIKKENYEVGNEFYDRFIKKNKKNKKFFKINKNKKYLFDLRGLVNEKLVNLKVRKIENIELDTFSEKNLFFSYRRSLINKESDYGRCISVILMT